MAKSQFMDWFVAQHGPRQKAGRVGLMSLTDQELEVAILTGEAARNELQRRTMWDEKYTSALYAWQAYPCIIA